MLAITSISCLITKRNERNKNALQKPITELCDKQTQTIHTADENDSEKKCIQTLETWMDQALQELEEIFKNKPIHEGDQKSQMALISLKNVFVHGDMTDIKKVIFQGPEIAPIVNDDDGIKEV